LPLFILFFISFSYSIEECSGEVITADEVPCYLFLPYAEDCTDLSISVYNETSFIYNQTLSNYSADQCNATFNQTGISTYPFLWSTGDTGSIIVEVNNMIDIFHVMVFSVLGLLGLVFMIMMHVFQEDDTSMVYGGLSSAVWIILAVINISGFNLIRNVEFIVDVNYYITGLAVILAIYNVAASYFFYKSNYKAEQNPYALRQ